MKVWGATIYEVTAAVRKVSAGYDDNIVFKREPEKTGRAVSFTLTVRDSKKIGSRRSNTGRRIAACCWHGHRDVMLGIFGISCDARIKSAFADYKGLADFSYKFPETGTTNIGSRCEPIEFQEACNCSEFVCNHGFRVYALGRKVER